MEYTNCQEKEIDRKSSSNKQATRIYRPTVLQGTECKACVSPEAEKILMGPEKEAMPVFHVRVDDLGRFLLIKNSSIKRKSSRSGNTSGFKSVKEWQGKSLSLF